MRPVFALIIAVVVLGGLRVFLDKSARSLGSHHDAAPLTVADGVFRVELTLTFDAGKDAFSLDAPDDAPSVLLQLHGTDILRVADFVSAETTLHAEPVAGIISGSNEFFLQVSPANPDSNVPGAARVRVFRDGNPLADQTIWTGPGGHVRGIVSVAITDSTSPTPAP